MGKEIETSVAVGEDGVNYDVVVHWNFNQDEVGFSQGSL